MSSAETCPDENAEIAANGFLLDTLTYRDDMTLREVLDRPVVLDSYPWVDNEYSSTPLGWQSIARNGYYFPALRYTRGRIEANASEGKYVDRVVAAALEECNHAHAQVCAYSEASMAALRVDDFIDEPIDDTTFEMIQNARTGSISVAHAGLLLLAYPRMRSLEAKRYTAGFDKNGLVPFDEYIEQSLDELQNYIHESQAPLRLERIAPDQQVPHYKESHADAALGARVEKHPIVSLEKYTIARLSGNIGRDNEMITVEYVAKKSRIANKYRHLLGPNMSPDILGSGYWRDVRTTKSNPTY